MATPAAAAAAAAEGSTAATTTPAANDVADKILKGLEELQAKLQQFKSVEEGRKAPLTADKLKDVISNETARIKTELMDGVKDFHKDAPNKDVVSGRLQKLGEDLRALISQDKDGSCAKVLESVSKLVEESKPNLEVGHLPVDFVAEVTEEYIEGPVRHILRQEAFAKSSADQSSTLAAEKSKLEAELAAALAQAQTRGDKQTAKFRSFEGKAQFFTKHMDGLQKLIRTDKEALTSIQLKATPKLAQTVAEMKAAVEASTANRNGVSSKKVTLPHKTPVLDRELKEVKDQLAKNAGELQTTLQTALRLIDTHVKLAGKLRETEAKVVVDRESRDFMKAQRTQVLGKLEQEHGVLEKSLAATEAYKGKLEAQVEDLRKLCNVQQKSIQKRLNENAKTFASLFREYWAQLNELKEGKDKCVKNYAAEIKTTERQIKQWEALEHEPSAARQLEQLDTRISQIKQQKHILENEFLAIRNKLTDLEKSAHEVLALAPVAGFVDPKEEFERKRAEALVAEQALLQNSFQAMASAASQCGGSVCGGDDPNNLSSSDDDAEVMVGSKRVFESPFLMQKRLKRISKEIQSNPYATPHRSSSAPQTSPTASPVQEINIPIPEELEMARKTKKRSSPSPDRVEREAGKKFFNKFKKHKQNRQQQQGR